MLSGMIELPYDRTWYTFDAV